MHRGLGKLKRAGYPAASEATSASAIANRCCGAAQVSQTAGADSQASPLTCSKAVT